MRRFWFLFIILLFPSLSFAATQNLDELIARQSRYAGQTYYNGEDASNYYIWQPESLCYIDTGTGREVWVLVHNPDIEDYYSKEHATKAFNADGSRIGFFNYTGRSTSNPNCPGDYDHRWVVNSDGSKLRCSEGYGKRDEPLEGFGWSNTNPDVVYTFGSSGETSDAGTGYVYTLYSNTYDSNNVATGASVCDTSGTDTGKKSLFKNGVSGDDTWIAAYSATEQSIGSNDPNTEIISRGVYFIGLDGTPVVDQAWGIGRGIGTYGNHENTSEYNFHDRWLVGTDWILGDYSLGSLYTLFKRSGSETDGGPKFAAWDGDSWGAYDEILIIGDSGASDPINPYDSYNTGHPAVDYWGRYIIVGLTEDVAASGKGTRIIDTSGLPYITGKAYIANGNEYDGYHHSFTGWSDYVAGVISHDADVNDIWLNNLANLYNYDEGATETKIVDTEHPGYTGNYNGYPRPSLSPDGTKVAFAACWLNQSGDDYPYISYVVALYPYPPEITACTATGGTVTTTFDYATDGTTRGYTARGWPTEGVSDPPPPREIEKFRLWRSADKSTWVIVDTVNASLFTMYNYATGAWVGGDSWTITDTPGDGTWYYAVTAQEWSGLESRTYSNIFAITVASGSGTGAQDTAYSATPGADANFYSTAPDPVQSVYLVDESSGLYTLTITLPATRTYVRYYNVYALDASAPTAIQQRRIASIPATADYDSNGIIVWKDWAGKTDGTTYYGVTSVSFQGDESSIVASGGSAVSGTIILGGCTESEIFSGGKTIVVTIVGTTLVATFGADNAITTAFIQGFDSAQSEAAGWNAEVRDKMTYTAVTRTDANTATVVLPATAGYQITSAETITLTIPATSTEAAEVIVATPTFVISAEYVGAESVSAVYNASGPSMTYNASGITITAP